MIKRTSYLYITLVLLIVAVCTSCGGNDTAKKEIAAAEEEESTTVTLTDTQIKTVDLRMGKVTFREISSAIKVSGVLDVPPQQLVSVSVPMGGFVKQTSLLHGMRVKKGQVIAMMENMDYIQLQQDYLDVRSQLEYAGTDYERQQELSKENVNALKVLQQSKAVYQSLSAKENGLRHKLALLNVNMPVLEKGRIQPSLPVYAPISGFVTQVNINTGQFVNPADILFRIVDTEHLHAELTVFEKDIPRLKIGQQVHFTLANETGDRTASIHLIGREISPERTVLVHCHLDEEDRDLLPGSYLQAVIATGSDKVPALPEEAIVNYENKTYIFIKGEDHHHFTMIAVQKGNSELGFTEITLPAGITADTPVVVKGAYDLLAQLKNSEEEGHGH